jgi:hypothetical protein
MACLALNEREAVRTAVVNAAPLSFVMKVLFKSVFM